VLAKLSFIFFEVVSTSTFLSLLAMGNHRYVKALFPSSLAFLLKRFKSKWKTVDFFLLKFYHPLEQKRTIVINNFA